MFTAQAVLVISLATYLVLMMWWTVWHFRRSSEHVRKLRDGEATAQELYDGWVRQNLVRSLPAATALAVSAVVTWSSAAEGPAKLVALPLGLLAFGVVVGPTVGLSAIEAHFAIKR